MVLQSRVTFTHTHFSAPSKMTSSTEIDVTPKRLKIAKFRLQILIDNSKSYLKRTYFFKIKGKMTKFMVLQSRVKSKFENWPLQVRTNPPWMFNKRLCNKYHHHHHHHHHPHCYSFKSHHRYHYYDHRILKRAFWRPKPFMQNNLLSVFFKLIFKSFCKFSGFFKEFFWI